MQTHYGGELDSPWKIQQILSGVSLVVWPWMNTSSPTSRSITSLLIWAESRKYVGKKYMSQDKGSLINQKIHVKAKEDKRFILCLLSAGKVQPLPRIQRAWQLLQKTNVVRRDASSFSVQEKKLWLLSWHQRVCWVSIPGCVFSHVLSHPNMLVEGGCWRWWMELDDGGRCHWCCAITAQSS